MPYYLDAPSLALATAVYTNSALTVCAPNGVYSDGNITRVQTGCVLGPAKFCPSCGEECGTSLSELKVTNGIYSSTVDLGNDPGDTGAIIIRFEPLSFPNGFKAVYDGITYNSFSSPVYGYSTAPSGLTNYIGDQDNDCGITSSSFILSNYDWNDTTNTYDYNGTTSVVSALPSQLNLSVNPPGTCVMVIPKVSLNPSSLDITIESPCGANFGLYVSCPEALLPILGSQVGISSASVCGDDQNITYYSAPVNGDGITLGLFDWIFLDPNGEIAASDGYYYSPSSLPSGYEWFLVSNGVIVQMGNCDWENYIIRRCGTQDDFVAESSIALTIGDLVTVSNVAYTGCTFTVVGQTNDTPDLTVNAISIAESCSDICVFYLVDNMTSSSQQGAYISCEGVFTTFTIPANTTQYICARSESITVNGNPGGVLVEFFDCNCNS
jgi:hypothetical protein